MPDPYERINVSERLIRVVERPDQFGFENLRDPSGPGSREAAAAYEPTILFGSTWTGEGLSDEVLVNTFATDRLHIPSSPDYIKSVIDPGLHELARIRAGLVRAARTKRDAGVRSCVDKGYEVLAGIMVVHAGRDRSAMS